MKKHLWKIIAAVVAALVLVLVFFLGGGSPTETPEQDTQEQLFETETGTETAEKTVETAEIADEAEEALQSTETAKKQENPQQESPKPEKVQQPEATPAPEEVSEHEVQQPAQSEPLPTAPAPEAVTTVSLTVDCSDILTDMDSLKKEKHGLVPDSGIMFSDSKIEVTEGESVFDVLKRTLTASGVHLEFNLAPVTNSAYIEGIGNIYEFDCGERSGWKYSVNGEYPRVGCSDFKIKPGDKIVFVYKIKAY